MLLKYGNTVELGYNVIKGNENDAIYEVDAFVNVVLSEV
jgi:hypothetical protein